MGLGNWQPAAEFNIYVDPQAAEMVFQSGIPVVMAGLDVTHKAQILPADIERFRQIGNPVSTIVAELLDFFMAYHKDEKWGFDGAPLHDPRTIAPQAGDLTTIERWVGVETEGKYRDDGGRLLPSDRQSAQYHPDAGCGPRSLCRSARPAVSLLRLTSMPAPFPAEKGPVQSKPAGLVRRDADHYLTEVLAFNRPISACGARPDRRSAVRDI